MKELEKYLSDFESRVLYIDSENHHIVNHKIQTSQILIITHERFKSIAIKQDFFNTFRLYEGWNARKRVIIIDECPPLVDGVTFEVGKDFEWLDFGTATLKDITKTNSISTIGFELYLLDSQLNEEGEAVILARNSYTLKDIALYTNSLGGATTKFPSYTTFL